MAQAETVIYEPPHPGLPYLVVTLTPTGVSVVPVKSNTEARVMIFTAQRAAAYNLSFSGQGPQS